MTLEELRKRSKLRLIVMSMSISLPLIVVIIMTIIMRDGKSIGETKSIFNYAPYVPFIICGLFLIWLVYKIVNYIKILKDEDFAKYALIKRNDERNKFIKLKVSALSQKIFLYVLGVVTIFCAFTDYQYFYTCVAIFILFIIINIIVTLIYYKKY